MHAVRSSPGTMSGKSASGVNASERIRATRVPSRAPGTQARQHVLRIELEEALLIRPRSMEHEMIEAEIDVRHDPLDVLVGIGRHDEALSRALHRQGICEALHLERI